MATVTILGAGAMGSALTTPAVRAGAEVRLWGTWLDDEILAELRAARAHPRLATPIDRSVALYGSAHLADAMLGADVAVLAITSDGVADVLTAAAEHLAPDTAVAMCTKGFGRDVDGRVRLLPALLDPLAADRQGTARPIVAIGGPCKANEVAAARPTATVYASDPTTRAERVADLLATEDYRITATDDVAGVETAAALKNAYAIALGIADGLQPDGRTPWHDLRSAVFARATDEMARMATAVGGRPATVCGLAGVGDLEVTGLSGRNREYGARLGRGEAPATALADMVDAGQTVEGVAAARLGCELAAQHGVTDLSLLQAISDVLDGADDRGGRLAEAALPARRPRG